MRMSIWDPLQFATRRTKATPSFIVLSCGCSYCANLSPHEAWSRRCGSFPWGWWLRSWRDGGLLERWLGFLLTVGEVAAAFTPLKVVVNFLFQLWLARCADKQNPTLLQCFGGAGQAAIL